ncbi:MAG: DUF1501 domain-containing protein [Pseudomonadota bacterium]|nr:MAG: DUF1501 domain-containing protein [Pseudomonadota bacterium]
MNRRELLKLMALSGLLAGTPRWIWAANPGDPAARRLLVIFLRGGADGLGICAPLGESRYFDLRPSLALSETTALDLDGFFGLHPAAEGLKALFDTGELAIVHATGLVTAERSHFEAQAAVEQGIDSAQPMLASGWLGRYVQTLDSPAALAAVAVDSALPRSMSGSSLPLAMASLDSFRLELDETAQAALQSVYEMDSVLGPTAQSVFDAAHIIEPLAELPAGAGYPAGDLGMALADTGRLIRGGTGLTVAAVNSGGWDHHDDQAARIEPLLTELATALLAFREDIDEFWTDTTVLVHTEFGRRAAENASGGTDHGHGSLMLVAGGGIRGGQVFGEWPGLGPDELSAGEDLAVTTDYRQVLAEILVNHMGLADPVDVFGDWQPGAWLGLFAGAGASDATAGRAVRLARRP